MSAPQFLVPALPDADLITLDGPEGHHAATVQRLRVGEELVVGDGRGTTAHAVVTAVGRGMLQARLGERTYRPQPAPRIVVVQGIAKADRSELAVQAMTEVGVDAIVPWSAARSVAQWKSGRSRQRWVDTAREAVKQARRAWVPDVGEASSTSAVANLLSTAARALVLHGEADARLTTVELPGEGDLVLVIGPEGGITPEELAAYRRRGAIAVRLGASVLRTSTAGPAAIAVLSARLGRW